MTNEEKYKTPEDRETAFRRYCAGTACWDNCKCRNSVARCEFTWLALEAEEEKPLPCPFCGSTNIKVMPTVVPGYVAATCENCFAASRSKATKADAITAWNRRVK